MKRFLPLLAGAGLIAAIAVAQQATPRAEVPPADPSRGGGNAYAVGGIAVDVSARSVDEARRIAWTSAQRQAWPQLWARLTGQPEAEAPALSDGQIDAMVAGIESEGERFSETRYIARLGVVFDRSRVAERLGDSINLLHAPPMLLLPVLVDGGAGTLFQAPNAWAQAWQRWRGSAITPMDYVLPAGSAADNLWLTRWQAQRPERGAWRTIVARFDTVDVLQAEAQITRSFPGGPVRALFIARHGPAGIELGRVALRVASEAGLPGLLDEGVRRIDGFYAAAQRDGRLVVDKDLAVDLSPLIEAETLIGDAAAPGTELELAVITPDADSLAAAERLLRAVAGADYLVRDVAIGGTSRIAVAFPGGQAALAEALAARGWELEPVDDALLLRRRTAAGPT